MTLTSSFRPNLGFDSQKYITLQSQFISQRRQQLGNKLYLEMGGKLFDDFHASRVLPGFTPNNKISMLQQLKDELEIMMVLNAKDLEYEKVRADLGITYQDEAMRLIDIFREEGFMIEHVVITQLSADYSNALAFSDRMQRAGLQVTHHYPTIGYPTDTETIISPEGFGQNQHAHTTRSLVVVTGPGPGSGKLSASMSQIYHDYQHGIRSGYAKFETFPIWNLPLQHPVNQAYEAATADLDDNNIIDPYHLAAYQEQAVSYNRDVEAFPLLKAMLEKLYGESPYQSPTDMGVNMAGHCISDDAVCAEAARQEVIRRWYKARVEERREDTADHTVSSRIEVIMKRIGVTKEDRPVVTPAVRLAERTGQPASAVELPDGTILTGKTSDLLGCSAAMLLNALKYMAGIDEDVHLLRPQAIEPIQTLKTRHLGSINPRLHTDEVLIALSVSAAESDDARKAIAELQHLRGCDVHTTTILGSVDESMFRQLGMLITAEPIYWRKSLYHRS
ncbi:DUF1846 domain-containing protein [Enteractinococcus coprophilus]|uniref:Uncharacterized protein (UPF0371 family) n=1 Tax=Enteractinococcus coprophilus TaxID=1027633 RepID=A0A543AJ55_9MICC|nr:DUF1846 domain-containing protein [Enteractinococcus coprophilus]TQL72556.1 uncharacterized protein (UPF0371 family) [Enteractinococcus coprophilus]